MAVRTRGRPASVKTIGRAKVSAVHTRPGADRRYGFIPEVCSQATPINDPGLVSFWGTDSTPPGGEFGSQASTSSIATAQVYGCCNVNAILGVLA